MYNFYGDVILKGIQCFNNEHGFVPWQHGQNILKELKSVNMIGYNINRLDSFIFESLTQTSNRLMENGGEVSYYLM